MGLAITHYVPLKFRLGSQTLQEYGNKILPPTRRLSLTKMENERFTENQL